MSFLLEFQSTFDSVPSASSGDMFYQENRYQEFGTPDLHPDGYDVVTDLDWWLLLVWATLTRPRN